MDETTTRDSLYKYKLQDKIKSLNLPTLYGCFVAIFLFIISILCFAFVSDKNEIICTEKNNKHNHKGIFIRFYNDNRM